MRLEYTLPVCKFSGKTSQFSQTPLLTRLDVVGGVEGYFFEFVGGFSHVCLPADMQDMQVHSLQTPSCGTSLYYLVGYKMKTARGRLVSHKAGRRDDVFSCARDAGWSTGQACAAVQVEDERDAGFPSTYCV